MASHLLSWHTSTVPPLDQRPSPQSQAVPELLSYAHTPQWNFLRYQHAHLLPCVAGGQVCVKFSDQPSLFPVFFSMTVVRHLGTMAVHGLYVCVCIIVGECCSVTPMVGGKGGYGKTEV